MVDWAAIAETLPGIEASTEADGFHPQLEVASELFNVYLNVLHQHKEQQAAKGAGTTHRRAAAR